MPAFEVPGQRRAGLPAPPGGGRPGAPGRHRRGRGRATGRGSTRSSASSATWASRAISWWSPISSAGPASRRSRSGPAADRARARSSPGPRHHGPRPDPARPAVRALPEPGARVVAGLRHRLLHVAPRPGIEYVADRYGRDRVSQIITFGSLAARAVVRDVGRVLGLPYGFVDASQS